MLSEPLCKVDDNNQSSERRKTMNMKSKLKFVLIGLASGMAFLGSSTGQTGGQHAVGD